MCYQITPTLLVKPITYYTARKIVYSCNTIINHMLKHIYQFGRYQSICYDNQPQGNTELANQTEETNNQQNQFQLNGEEICDALHDLVPFVQFKKREKHPYRSVNFSKVAG